MTLEAYTSDQLDELSLRVMDVCAQLRTMSRRAREAGLKNFPLHDKKALEWLGKLEQWSQKSTVDFELTLVKHRGTRRAAEASRRK